MRARPLHPSPLSLLAFTPMTVRSRCAALALGLAVLAVTGCIAPSNPYDGDTPRELQARARLHGTVTLGDAPVAARVTVSDGSASSRADTDEDGAYAIDIAPGTWSVVVTADGAAEASRSVVLAPGEDAALDFALTDNVPPQGASLLVADGAAITNDPTPPVVADARGAVRVLLKVVEADGAESEPRELLGEAPFVVDDLTLGADGTKLVVAQLFDAAGNSVIAQASIELDTAPPVLGAEPVSVAATDGFVSSVSTTVSFDVSGASTLALTISGPLGTEALGAQPFAPTVTVLLPASECAGPADVGCIEVCAVFADAAGNVTTTPACDAVTLDTTAPAAPIIVEGDAVVRETTVTLHIENSADGEADQFPVTYEVLVDPRTPTFVPVPDMPQPDDMRQIVVELAAPPVGALPHEAAQANTVHVRAVDAAGNRSPESTLSMVVDPTAPPAPAIAPVPQVTNADTVSVNFLTGNGPLEGNTADDDATFDHYRVSTSLLPSGFDTTLRDGILVSLLPEQTNTITVVAWDAAGNASEPSTVSLRHDSLEPSAPTLAPLYAEVRKGPVEMGLRSPSRDTQLGAGGPIVVDVGTYQLKDGVGASFTRIPAGQPILASLRAGRDNDVCVRGVDDAGNTSIEDCAVIAETSTRDVTANADQVGAFDVFGDFMLLNNPEGTLLRDLRSGDDTPIAPSDGVFRSAFSSHFHASGDPRRAVLVYESPGNRITLAHAQLAQDPPVVLAGQLVGNSPYVRGNDLVFYAQGRVRHRTADLPAAPVPFSPTMTYTPDPADVGDDMSGLVVLCPGTAPRVSNGVVVWCSLNGSGDPEVRANLIATPIPGGALLSEQPVSRVRRGTLLGDSTDVQQPQVADGMLAWVEGGPNAPRVVVLPLGAGGALDPSLRVETSIESDDLRDLSRGIITGVLVHEGITSDIGIANVATGVTLRVTDDTSPQDQPTLDDTRLFFSDTATGDLVRSYDISGLRWVRATFELAFEPVTSKSVTAWIESIGGDVRLVARALPIDAPGNNVVPIDDAPPGSVAFFGPAKADPTFAVGGRRVAYAVGEQAPFSLRLREITASGSASANALELADDALGPFAIDPDGDALVYVDMQGAVQRIELPATLPASTPGAWSVTTVPMAGAGVIRMIDVDEDVVVVQRGGNPDQPTDSSGLGDAYCSAGGSSALISAGLRGPKVARLPDGQTLFAAVAGADADARYCFLDCAAPTPCVAADASSSRGSDSFVQVTRDGHIAYLNDELTLRQVVLFDIYARRWSFVTLDDVDHAGLSAAEKRVTWADPSLGGFAVFELTLP